MLRTQRGSSKTAQAETASDDSILETRVQADPSRRHERLRGGAVWPFSQRLTVPGAVLKSFAASLTDMPVSASPFTNDKTERLFVLERIRPYLWPDSRNL